MPTRRSARVRAVSASKNTANNPSDENTTPQSRKRRAGKTTAATEKQTVQKQDTQRKAVQPLRDVTNSVPNTRSRRTRKTAPKSSKEKDDKIAPVPPRRTTRSRKRALQPSAPSHEIRPADLLVDTAQCNVQVEKPGDNVDDEMTPAPQQCSQPPQLSVTSKEVYAADSTNETTRLNVEVEGSSSDEIRPNPPQRNSRTATHAPQSSVDQILPNVSTLRRRKLSDLSQSSAEIRPNPPKRNHRTPAQASSSSSDEIGPNITSTQRSRELSRLTQGLPDEIQPGPARNKRPLAATTGLSWARPASLAISDSPPISPVAAKEQTEPHQTSWPDENRDPNRPAFDTKRPRRVVHTYGKRRHVARVSLPTMQALGVRAKSPNSGSQSGSEKEDDGEASEEYSESEDESEDSPKRDPKLQAFLAEQKRLWQEVDEADLLVESD